MAGEYDNGQLFQLGCAPNEFQNFNTAAAWHDHIQQDQVRPADRSLPALVHQRLKIRNRLIRRITYVPVKGHITFSTGRLHTWSSVLSFTCRIRRNRFSRLNDTGRFSVAPEGNWEDLRT